MEQKKNYLFDDVSEAIIASRFKPEPTVDDPRYKLLLQKKNPERKKGKKFESQKVQDLENVIRDTQKIIDELDHLNKTTQNQIQLQLEILKRSTEELLVLHDAKLEDFSQSSK